MPSGALVTVSSSDRPSQSLLLCHGFGALSSRSLPCALRRRGRAAPPAHLSPMPSTLRDLRGVRPGARLLHGVVPDARSSPLGAGGGEPAISARSKGASTTATDSAPTVLGAA